MVFTASLLGTRHLKEVVENKPASSLVALLGKALNETPRLYVEDRRPRHHGNGNSRASADVPSKIYQCNLLSHEWRLNMANKKKKKMLSQPVPREILFALPSSPPWNSLSFIVQLILHQAYALTQLFLAKMWFWPIFGFSRFTTSWFGLTTCSLFPFCHEGSSLFPNCYKCGAEGFKHYVRVRI